MHSRRFTLSVLSIAVLSHCILPGEARLGEPIATFQSKLSKDFVFKGSEGRGSSTYYRFALKPTPQEEETSPGFGAGMTITVSNGRIVGQSMALRIGQYFEAGKGVVARRALRFILEAIGKPMPRSQADEDRQCESVRLAIDESLRMIPQNMQFPGSTAKIQVQCSPSNGDVIIAVRPDSGQQSSSLAPPGSYLKQ